MRTILLLLLSCVTLVAQTIYSDDLILSRSSSLLQGLQGYWRLEEASGTRYDRSKNGNHLTANNTPGSASGVSSDTGNCVTLASSSSQSLSITSNSSLSVGNVDFTIAVWARLASLPANEMDIVSKFDNTANKREYRIHWVNTTNRFQFSGTSDGIGAAGTFFAVLANNLGAVSTNVWYFIVAWHDSQNDTVNIQVNNGTVNSLSWTQGVFQSTSPFAVGMLGRPTGGLYFDGNIDEVGFWKRVLTPAERAILYNSGRGVTHPQFHGINYPIDNTAAWTWYSDPRGFYDGNSIWLGGSSGSGSSIVRVTDLQTPSINLLPSTLQDDHNNPAFLKRSQDNRWIALMSAHDGAGEYMCVSTTPNDASAWGDKTLITGLGISGFSYNNPCQLSGESGKIYNFLRGTTTNLSIYYTTSTNAGTNWSAAVKLFTSPTSPGHGPYLKSVTNSTNRIDFFLTDGHPVEVATNSLWHCYYDSGSFYKSDGTSIRTISQVSTNPIVPSSDCTLVWDGNPLRSWNWDSAYNSTNGNPQVAFVVFQNSPYQATYKIGYWNGSAWSTDTVCDAGGNLYAGETYYVGGIAIDPTDSNTVVTSSGPQGGPYELSKYVWNGSAWASNATYNAQSNAIRPWFIRGMTTGSRLAYMYGTYTSYTDYSTHITTITP